MQDIPRPEMPAYDPTMAGDPDYEWQVSEAGAYDSCADLSGVLITIAGATGSTDNNVAFFHRGEYVGVADDPLSNNYLTVTRVSGGQVVAGARYGLADEPSAMMSSRTEQMFSWNTQSNQLHRGPVRDTTP